MTIAPERLNVEAAEPAPETPLPVESTPRAPIARLALAAALASAAAAWVVAGLLRDPLVPRLIALGGIAIGAGLVTLSFRFSRPTIVQYSVLPVSMVVGALLIAPEARGGTANLFGLVGEAAAGGGLQAPPIPFDPGWRFILVVLFALVSSGALTLAAATGRPRTAIMLPLPLVLGGALFQPPGSEVSASAVAILLLVGALGVAYGADLERDGVATRGFETRRLARGGAMLAALLVAMLVLARADALFPDTSRDRIVPPRKPPAAPPEPDRQLFVADTELPGPWRVGVLDVYDGRAWLLPPQDPARIVPFTPATTTRDTFDVRFRVTDLRGQSLPVPGGLVGMTAPAAIEIDPRTGVPRLERRVPQGFAYTARAAKPPTGRELNAAPEPNAAIAREFLDDGMLPPAPNTIVALLAQAPTEPLDRLQFLRDRLYANVTAAGGGSPTDVPPAAVAAMFRPGAEATPFEITAAEALLARWAGIPSRIGYGYYRGEKISSGTSFRPKHAAAWLETWFEGHGWVPLVGTPTKAKPSDTSEQKNADPRVRPSEELALTVFIPMEHHTIKALFEIIRYYIAVTVPLLLAMLLLAGVQPMLLKSWRASRRRRWARRNGPAGRTLVAYCEFRDLCHDLNVGDHRDTPLEFLRTFTQDDEHEELAWLVTRLVWGDLTRAAREADAEAAEEMARSVSRRLLAEQTLINRVLSRLSRASLRDPWSDAVPTVPADLGIVRRARAIAPTALTPFRLARRFLRRRSVLRTTSLMLVLALGAGACVQREGFDRATAPVAYPERIVPEAPDSLLGYRFKREPKAEAKYREVKQRALVTEGRVYTVGKGNVVEASLQVALFRPDVDTRDRRVREDVEASIGSFTNLRVGTARLRVREEPERRLFLWFPPERNVMELLVTRKGFADGELLARAIVAYQRDLPVEIFAPRPPGSTTGPVTPTTPAGPTVPGADPQIDRCRPDGDRRPSGDASKHPATPGFTLIPPGPVTDRVDIEARVAVRNPTGSSGRYRVRFWWDRPSGATLIHETEVTLPAGASAVASAKAPAAGHAGSRRIVFNVEGPGVSRSGSQPIRVVRSSSRAVPQLGGMWIDLLGFSQGVYARDCPVTAADVRDMVDAMDTAGVTTIILTYVEYQGHFFYPSRIGFYDRDIGRVAKGELFTFDVVGTIMDEAERNGQHVFLGLGRGGDTHLMGDHGKPGWVDRRNYAVDLGGRVARELWSLYGKRRSFYGWYLTHESAQLERGSDYYNPISDVLHGIAPDKPVMIAPTGAPIITEEDIRNSRVDVFAYQDAVGAGYDGASYTYDPEVRMRQLPETYRRYRELHDEAGKHLWADLELWEMDGSQGYSGAYPAPFERVRRQLTIEKDYVDFITGYEWAGFMESPRARSKLQDQRARALYSAYTAYRRGTAR